MLYSNLSGLPNPISSDEGLHKEPVIFLDRLLPFLYIQPIPKQVFITYRFIAILPLMSEDNPLSTVTYPRKGKIAMFTSMLQKNHHDRPGGNTGRACGKPPHHGGSFPKSLGAEPFEG